MPHTIDVMVPINQLPNFEALDMHKEEADGPEKLLDVLQCSGLVFDQAILYRRKRFLHLSLKINGNNRMQVLVYNKS